jgi:ATP-dependent Clp protease protease subunit
VPARRQVDLYNRLYRERIVFLGQQISDDIANQIIGVMLYLDSEVRSSPPASACLVALHPEACP